jgi:hypothetical protein
MCVLLDLVLSAVLAHVVLVEELSHARQRSLLDGVAESKGR